MANNNGDIWEDVKDVVLDTAQVAESLGQVISDTWGPGSAANSGLHANDLTAALDTLGEEFGQLSLLAATAFDSMTSAPDQAGAIAAGDQEAGRIANSAVVSDGDIGQLEAAYSNISGMSAEGQFAQARVGAAINAARAKLAAARVAADYNPADSADYAQQFGSREAYDAYKQQQLEAMKRADDRKV